MSLFERIKSEIPSGMVFYTPVRKVKFTVYVEADEVVFLAGRKPSSLPLLRACWDGIQNFLTPKRWVEIGATHGKAREGTLQYYDDEFHEQGKPHQVEAEYVASVLEYLRIVEVDPNLPSKVRLL